MYDPTEDEEKQLYARMKGIKAETLANKPLDDATKKEMNARLKKAEANMLYIHRHCHGDASETGLVQFAQAIMDLDETREQYPTHKYEKDGK